ncbi:unnamed protein product [Oikopleura dioica]|uniref:C-type lectin domain-containing protein n=1 Tax=Oikopleura dioica TaxID=34765 RepID=E4XWT4_OIKDI|nr:unnamed protein product [Oikopleura dioica]
MWFSCRYDINQRNQLPSGFGPIIKRGTHWTKAVQECRQHGGTVAFINNEEEFAVYQDALGLPPTFVGIIWLGRPESENPLVNSPNWDCLRYAVHREAIKNMPCDRKIWFSCRYQPSSWTSPVYLSAGDRSQPFRTVTLD